MFQGTLLQYIRHMSCHRLETSSRIHLNQHIAQQSALSKRSKLQKWNPNRQLTRNSCHFYSDQLLAQLHYRQSSLTPVWEGQLMKSSIDMQSESWQEHCMREQVWWLPRMMSRWVSFAVRCLCKRCSKTTRTKWCYQWRWRRLHGVCRDCCF